MKKAIFVLFLGIALLTQQEIKAQGQGWNTDCTVPSFGYIAVMGGPHIGSFELGKWPQEDLLGYAGGVSYIQRKYQPTKQDPSTYRVEFDMYGKGIIRVHRYLYLTASAGWTTIINGYAPGETVTHLYWNTSARLSIPLGTGRVCSMLLEPMYGYHGAMIQGGIGIAL